MFENIMKFLKKIIKKQDGNLNSKDTAKERLHLVLMQDRANVSADFLDLMRQEIIDVIKKYIDVDESAIDVRLTNKENEDGTTGAPALYANIPILNIKEEGKMAKQKKEEEAVEEKQIEETQQKDEEAVEHQEAKQEAESESKVDKNEDEQIDKKEATQEIKQENNNEQQQFKQDYDIVQEEKEQNKEDQHKENEVEKKEQNEE